MSQAVSEALEKFPGQVDLLRLQALTASRLEHHDEALRLITGVRRQYPNQVKVLRDWSVIAARSGRGVAAMEVATNLSQRLPERQDLARFAAECVEQVDVAAGLQRYYEIVQQWPDDAASWARIAHLEEGANALDAAARAVGRALNIDPDQHLAQLTQATLAARRGDHEGATSAFRKLLQQPSLPPKMAILAAGRLGKSFHELGQYAKAWRAFSKANQALSAHHPPSGQSVYSAASVKRYQNAADRHTPTPSPLQPSAAFLLGFPRSGTTLMEQILASHSQVVAVEEDDVLARHLLPWLRDDSAVAAFHQLGRDELASLGSAYLSELQQLAGVHDEKSGAVVVDKLPLNAVFIDFIGRLFPQARIVLALRDPRDVVLSCFMQTFGTNDAMAQLTSVETAAEYYHQVMQLVDAALPQLGPRRLLTLRYEDLLDDLEGQARRLCDFLGVEFQPAMQEYRRRARSHRINTPSYSQVVQPLYRSAQGRWRHYREHLEPVLPLLQPWVQRWGYDGEATGAGKKTSPTG